MEALLKLLELALKSKTVACGLVVVALLAIVGPRYAPGVLPAVPDGWAWLPWVLLVVCGCQLLFLVLAGGGRLAGRMIGSVRRWIAGRGKLENDEERLLLTLGAARDQTIHLGQLALHNPDQLALAFKATADKLTARGLIDRNPYDHDICSLTGAGRARTLELQREIAAGSPPPLGRGDWVRHRSSGRVMRVVETMQPSGRAVQAGALPVICQWTEPDGRTAKNPFPPDALERIEPPQ
ncbi:hypothetical protein ACQUKI_20440 [Ralstonia pseudosolanacearum]